MSDDRLRLAFAALHPDQTRGLLARYGSPGRVLAAVESGRLEVHPAGRAAARVPAAARRAELEALGVAVVVREELPEHLRVLPDCPDLLFARGVLPEWPAVAVVGTRRATTYGLRLSRRFGRRLAEAGWPVVSGLARGVDGEAHRGVLEAGGTAVGVLGCGIDVCYPAEHRDLLEAVIAGGGAVVTEFPPGTRPDAWRFPPRNRIISGLAGLVVVVEAAERGGALITARTAVEQGRDVLVVPGDLDRDSSRGCNLLIRDGAHPVLDEDDLVEAVERVMGPAPRPTDPPPDDSDPLLAVIGPVGRPIEWLADRYEGPVNELLTRLTLLEAAGRLRLADGMAIPT